jgi:hypothetical protein
MIAHNINYLRHAYFRIDKVMATNIRSFAIFRMNQENTGNMSIFHCFPRQPVELQDMITGEEFKMKLKAKAISSNLAKSYFDSKPGIALSASQFTKQLYNFWQFNGFMFGDEAWISRKVQEIYEIF